MLSKRLPGTLSPNRLTELLAERREKGETILDLTESNPTRAGIDYPEGEILQSLADPRNLTYEPAPLGLTSAREAVARYYAARGRAVGTDRMALTASTSEAYSFLFKLLAGPGDRILAPRPSYPLLEFLTALESVELAFYPLSYESGAWCIDLGALSEAISERTRAIVLVNPNNPTGSYVKRRELERLLAICRDRKLPLISDEVFSDYPLDIDPAHVPSLVGATEGVLTFVLNGLSKVAGLPQMKLGWIIVEGPESERRDAIAALEHVADTFLSVGAPVQNAAPRLLDLAPRVQAAIHARLSLNRRALDEGIREDSASRVLRIEGGWYAVLRLPNVLSSELWAIELLSRDSVHVHPGYLFDFPSEAYLVLSLLTPVDTFRAGVQRLERRVEAVLSQGSAVER